MNKISNCLRVALKEGQKISNEVATFLTPPQTDPERAKSSSEDFQMKSQKLDSSETVTENKRASHA